MHNRLIDGGEVVSLTLRLRPPKYLAVISARGYFDPRVMACIIGLGNLTFISLHRETKLPSYGL
jgi:hypothetical protein